MGCLLSNSELLNVLRSFKCDRDEDGKFCVDGSITSFMGAGEEFCIGDDAIYYVDKKPRNLAMAIAATSYGTKVNVI